MGAVAILRGRHGRSGHRAHWRRQALVGYAFISLNLIGFLVFTLGPVLASFGLSFSSYDLLTAPRFIGLQNYREILFQDPLIGLSLRNTLYYAVLGIPLGMVAALTLALLVNQKIRGAKVYRTIYFIPVVCSMVAVSLVWKWLYNKEFGLINYLLSLVGIAPVYWLGHPAIAMPAIVLMCVWKGVGSTMVIFLAGLQSIPEHLYDAAKVDGANAWQRFWHVTLPLLSPTTFFILVLSIISSFQVFDQVYLMTGGGPGNSTMVYSYYLYQNAFRWLKMGLASSMAYLLFAIMFAITLIQMRFLGQRVTYELG